MTTTSAEAPKANARGEALRLERQICFALYSASNLFTRFYKPFLAPLGLTYLQYVTMMVLWETSPQTVGDLCRRLTLDSGTLSPLLMRLEATGLITRQRDPGDQRRVVITLTDKGEALREPAAEVPRKMRRLLPVSVADAMALMTALTAFNESLSEALQNEPVPPV